MRWIALFSVRGEFPLEAFSSVCAEFSVVWQCREYFSTCSCNICSRRHYSWLISPFFFPFEVYFLTGPKWRDLLLSTRAPACLLENIPKRRLNGMVDEFLHIRTRPSLLVRALLKLSRIRGRSIKSGGNVSIPLVLEEKSKGLSGKGKIGRAERLNSQLIQMIEVSFFSLITLSPQIPPTYFRMRLVRRIVGNHQVLAGI